MDPKFKLVSSSDFMIFEERLNGFIAGLARDDVIVDVKFSTAAVTSGDVEFSALVHYQQTEAWEA